MIVLWEQQPFFFFFAMSCFGSCFSPDPKLHFIQTLSESTVRPTLEYFKYILRPQYKIISTKIFIPPILCRVTDSFRLKKCTIKRLRFGEGSGERYFLGGVGESAIWVGRKAYPVFLFLSCSFFDLLFFPSITFTILLHISSMFDFYNNNTTFSLLTTSPDIFFDKKGRTI